VRQLAKYKNLTIALAASVFFVIFQPMSLFGGESVGMRLNGAPEKIGGLLFKRSTKNTKS